MELSDNISSPTIISLEGNIGSGKSTLLEVLRKMHSNDSSICFIDEPLSIWNQIKDSSGETILEKYYADQKNMHFRFK